MAKADEKEVILRELLYHWRRMPSLRLGQLILNAVEGKTLFYIDDIDLIEDIRAYHEAEDELKERQE